jgi:hypothetical protein
MLCSEEVLGRALSAYQKYLPTASEHLRETREQWIPVQVQGKKNRAFVCRQAEAVLTGGVFDKEKYRLLPEEYRVAIALTAMQGYAEHMAALLDSGATSETEMTTRFYTFLLYIPLDHATLAIRNAGHREGGPFGMRVICGLKLTKVNEVMALYMSIKRKWDARGMDWKRRELEEKALRARK